MARPATAAVRLLSGEREPVRVATTANIELDGLQTIDGVALAVNDRVLVKNQTDARENGIYTVSSGSWHRASDARFPRAMAEGTTVHVQEGTANGTEVYRFSSGLPRIGIDPIEITFYLSGNILEEAQAALAAVPSVFAATIAELKAVNTSDFTRAYLTEEGREGQFIWRTGNFSAMVTADSAEGIYVAPNSDPTGASGAWVRVYSGEVNVQWWGAKGDRITNDTLAFLAMAAFFDDLLFETVAIRVPQGGYVVNERIPFAADKLSLRGDGKTSTRIHYGGTTGLFGFKFRSGDNDEACVVDMRDITLLATVANAGTAVHGELENTAIDAGYSNVLSFQNVNIGSRAALTNNWTKGFVLRDVGNVTFQDTHVSGQRNNKSALIAAYELTASNFASQAYFVHANATWVNDALLIGASTVPGNGFEGVHLLQSNFVAVNRGVSHQAPGEPHLSVIGCHINYDDSAIVINGTDQFFLIGNLIYSQTVSATSALLVQGVATINHAVIIGNILQDTPVGLGQKSANSNGLNLASAKNITVQGNHFRWWLNGVVCGSEATNNTISGNVFNDCTTGVFGVTGSTGNRIEADNRFLNVGNWVFDEGANLFIRPSFAYTVVKTLAGGGNTEVVDFSIPAGLLNGKPDTVEVTSQSGLRMIGQFLYDDAASTATNARCIVETVDGSAISAGGYRFGVRIN